MHKTVSAFWLVLAILYAGLAAVSYHYGKGYDQKLSKAPTEQVTETGAKVLQTDAGTIVYGGSSGQDDVVVADLWKDLRAYLNVSMWVNLVGFGLAALAAGISFRSSRPEAQHAGRAEVG